MKKYFHYLTMFTFSFASITPLTTNNTSQTVINNVISEQKTTNYDTVAIDSTTNIDLNKMYKPHQIIMKERGYNGTYYNKINNLTLKTWLISLINGDKDIIKDGTKKLENIKHLTDAFLSPSNNYSPIPIIERFASYKDLKPQLNQELQQYWQKLIDHPMMCKQHGEKDELKKLIVWYYNFITTYWPKTDISTFLNKLNTWDLIDNNKKVMGMASWTRTLKSCIFAVEFKNKTLDCKFQETMDKKWKEGWWSTNSFFHTLIHELGHILDFNDYYKNCNPSFEYEINQGFALKNFLRKKINHFSSLPWLNEELLIKSFAPSNYGSPTLENGVLDYSELYAEGFAYLVLTPSTMRTKAWDFWNEFFCSYLPQVRAKILLSPNAINNNYSNKLLV